MVAIDPNGWSTHGVDPREGFKGIFYHPGISFVERILLSTREARLGPLNIVSRYQAQSGCHIVLGAIVSEDRISGSLG